MYVRPLEVHFRTNRQNPSVCEGATRLTRRRRRRRVYRVTYVQYIYTCIRRLISIIVAYIYQYIFSKFAMKHTHRVLMQLS